MADVKEVYLELPWGVVEKCNGFAIDFGGSVCKFIYLHKDDWVESSNRKQDTVRMRCAGVSREDFDTALTYLKTNAYITRVSEDEKPVIHITGVGGAQMEQKICETFDIRTTTVQELECFVSALRFLLRNKTVGDITQELDKDFLEVCTSKMRDTVKFLGCVTKDCPNMLVGDPNESVIFPMEWPFEAEKIYAEYDNIFPCFMVMVGSNGGVFLVNGDGTYKIVAGLKRVGRSFLGVASLLTKSKNETIVKESKLGQNEEAENIKADQFSSEDIARGYLFMVCNDLVQTVHSQLPANPSVKHVFFCGGFPSHPLTRDMITQEWIRRDGSQFYMSGQKEFAQIHFLKHGHQLGALGAYLNPHLQFKPTTQASASAT